MPGEPAERLGARRQLARARAEALGLLRSRASPDEFTLVETERVGAFEDLPDTLTTRRTTTPISSDPTDDEPA